MVVEAAKLALVICNTSMEFETLHRNFTTPPTSIAKVQLQEVVPTVNAQVETDGA